jgi:plastocyanin
MRAIAALSLVVFSVLSLSSATDHGPGPTDYGPRPTAHGLRPTDHGPRPTDHATGAIRGRVDVRVSAGPAPSRPDPVSLGMASTRDPIDRRRSVVYLESAPQPAFEANEQRRGRMDQRDERFVPHVLAIVAGTWVDFPNDDKTYHNVFSLSKTQEFNLGRYAAGHSKAVRFENPGIVRVFCEIHSHMSAFILVFAHRYFAVTDDDGRYRIDGIPPGTYTVAVWNETQRGDPPKRTVTIEAAGGDVDADFSIK